jgi:hypothetical protein
LLSAHPHVPAGADKRKRFLFEKKKQKTFAILVHPLSGSARQMTKVFWFFFSKKNTFFLQHSVKFTANPP